MEEKSWNEMNGWERTWEVTKIGIGITALIVFVPLILLSMAKGNSRSPFPSQGGPSVWTVGSGGKKLGSWSSGRHG